LKFKAKMKKFLILSFLILLSSCGNNLSRSKAEELINNSPKFQKTGEKPKIHSGAYYAGIEQGYWTDNRNLTSKGYKYFNKLSYDKLYLKKPIKCVVTSIDGIAESNNFFGNENSNYKEVQFSWEFSNVNSVVKRFIVKGGKGVAFLRKFDDGWRVDEVSVKYSDEKFALNKSEKKNVQRDIELEKQRKLEEQRRIEEERARRKAEEERRQRLIAESKIIHKTIGTYDGVHGFTGRKLDKKIILTDVHIFRDLPGTENYLNIWYGNIRNKPTAHRFRQTAMAWDGFAVQVDNTTIVFKDENEATRFYQDLIKAIEDWNERFPDLRKW